MILKDIKVGHDYFVGGVGMGKARVISPPERKYPQSKIFDVQIEFPDAGPEVHERRRKTKVNVRSIARMWTEQDQEKFTKSRMTIENKRGWEEELRLAGFDGTVSYQYDGEISVIFKGRAANILLQHLTGHEIPEAEKALNG